MSECVLCGNEANGEGGIGLCLQCEERERLAGWQRQEESRAEEHAYDRYQEEMMQAELEKGHEHAEADDS